SRNPSWRSSPRRKRCAASRQKPEANSRIASASPGSRRHCVSCGYLNPARRGFKPRDQVVHQPLERIEADDVPAVRHEVRERVDVVEVVLAVAIVDQVLDSANVEGDALGNSLYFANDLSRRLELFDPHAVL